MTNSPIYRNTTLSLKPKDEYAVDFAHWETLIRGGNTQYEQGGLFSAIGTYHQAILAAKVLVSMAPAKKESLTALLTSYHNLADAYLSSETAPCNTQLSLAYGAITEVEGLIDTIERQLPRHPHVVRCSSIARQQRFVFLKRYPHFAALQCEHPTRSNLQYIKKALH